MGVLKVYACYSTDIGVRLSSSSGAVFSSLAENVLEKQGVVYGVAMAEDCYSAEFISVTSKEHLTKLRGSKYLQAKVGNTYRSVKEALLSGKLVLFSGTGCQVNGLKSFLGKEYENLICVDVICHGAPSPALWWKYATYQEQKNGGKLKGINFRCKDDGWTDFGMEEICKSIPDNETKKLCISKDKDAYMQMFLRDYCLRPSCYECTAKKVKMSDLTIADFWGINDVAPDMNDGMGTSLVLIRTEKGKDVFEKLSDSMKLKEVSYEEGVRGNPAEYKSCARPLQRDTFFDDMHNMSFEELKQKYASPIKVSFITKVKRKAKIAIKKVLRVIGGGREHKHNALLLEPFINQRILAEVSGHSLGVVNRSLKNLIKADYLDDSIRPTVKAITEFKEKTPQRAIILAAGFGMRMVPINTEMPKGLLEVNGEPLIERIIKQLHEVGIKEIYVVVGFMKEKYEYLIDDYGVELIVNTEYAAKNNLHSLKLVKEHLENSYIVPCDIWCDRNPFHRHELYSWYMVSDLVDNESNVRVNRKMELVTVPESSGGNAMIGICYLIKDDADIVERRIEELCGNQRYDGSFWEEALYHKDRMIVAARVVHSADVVEINTYEQLREIDSDSNQLKTDAIQVIGKALNAKSDEITDITVLKKGMTNRSFLFTCKGKKYIMRIPGEGTDQLINRRQEAEVYHTIDGKKICDDIAYINPENGYKITEFLEGARVCDPLNYEDVKKCMKRLRNFHELKLKVNHEFDIFNQMEFYESLWDGTPSVYKDYAKTKANVLSLKEYIDTHISEKVLTHIDAVPDNFLFVEKNGQEEIRLIDWEYAGMQDPHVDVAMFCIYSLYNKRQVDRLIAAYFTEGCDDATRIKIYCYIAACGLLWSNWCEYKRNLGVEFGEYSLRQYRYAKEYYRIVQDELKKQKEREDN